MWISGLGFFVWVFFGCLFSHSVNAIPVYLCCCGITGTEAEMQAFSLTKKQA